MKERPILMNGPMVRATLDGSKTQTRRVVKMKQSDWCRETKGDCWHPNDIAEWRMQNGRWFGLMGWYTLAFADCPYGQPGDRLWVRETYFGNHFLHPDEPEEERELHYRADGIPDFEGEEREIRWRPSIHMPRWASRILLEITAVRVERLQDISGNDARSEGCPDKYVEGAPQGEIDGFSKWWFAELWESINGPGSWGANPWVWVIEFKRVE